MEIITREIPVVFHLAEVAQNLGVGPFVVTPLSPLVIILGQTSEDNLAVNRAGAAGSLASGDDYGFWLQRCRSGAVVPTVGAISGTPDIVSLLEVLRQMFEVWVIRPGFQQ